MFCRVASDQCYQSDLASKHFSSDSGSQATRRRVSTMSKIKTTTWNIDEHTRVKHAILERYLSAWIPILGKYHTELLYIDGFAGPGKYSNGEAGSPIIAIRTALKYTRRSHHNMRLVFVERDRKRADFLKTNLSGFNTLGKRIEYDIKAGVDFQFAWQDLVEEYESNDRPLPPTFAFIDPFGWKGIPHSVLKDIMSHSRSEIFITFMYDALNRFLDNPDQAENFRELFDTDDWQQESHRNDAQARKTKILSLYRRKLQERVAKYVLHFEMKNANNATKYFLFYATNSLKGVSKMKEAMWKSDPRGNYRFSDAADPNQGELFGCSPNYSRLEQLILDRFEGSVATIRQIEEFVLVETPFRETHYKVGVLRKLEKANPPKIEVMCPPKGRRKGTFPSDNMKIQFMP